MRIPLLFALAVTAFTFPSFAHAASWPASSGTAISASLQGQLPPSGNAFEPSDATIVDGQLLLVSDEGDVATMGFDGTNVAMWLTWAGNDQEGVTVVGNTLYVLNERYRDVYAYDLASHALLRTYDLSPWISGSDNEGPEGFAYHNGQWLVGHSVTEEIFAFDLSGETPVFLDSWASGLHVRAIHSGADGKLYVMSSGRVAVFDGTTQLVDYTLPSGPSGPEGFALSMDCAAGSATAFIAYDSGPVYRYDGFPVTCAATSTPAPEPAPEPEVTPAPVAEPDPVTFASVAGTTNGSIVVTYSDGSTATYQVYAMTTSTAISTAYAYKDSAYLVVVAPFGKRVAVVDADTGEVVAVRQMPRSTSVLSAWLVSILGF